MNRQRKLKLAKLVTQCEDALRDKARQSHSIFRGDMWAIISAAHELRKRGLLDVDGGAAGDAPGVSTPANPKAQTEAEG